jgi:hypothetical protein
MKRAKQMRLLDEFSDHMLQGIRLMNLRKFSDAEQSFLSAIALQERGDWWYGVHGGWYLAGAYLNLSDLRRTPELADPTIALAAVHCAKKLLHHEDFGESARYWERWVICLMKEAALYHDGGLYAQAADAYENVWTAWRSMQERIGESRSALLKRMLVINHAHFMLDQERGTEASQLLDQEEILLVPTFDASLQLSWLAVRCRAWALELEAGNDAVSLDAIKSLLRQVFDEEFRMLQGDERLNGILRFGDDFYRRWSPDDLPQWAEADLIFQGARMTGARKDELRGALLLAIRDLELRTLYGQDCMPEDRERATQHLQVLQKLMQRMNRNG